MKRNVECYCGSGKKYKRCCGSPSAERVAMERRRVGRLHLVTEAENTAAGWGAWEEPRGEYFAGAVLACLKIAIASFVTICILCALGG